MSSKSKSVELISKYIDYITEKNKYGMNPVTALDYSSLYPSLIMTYNLSPEYLITDLEYKEEVESKGYPIHDIDFVYNYEDVYENKRSRNIKGWTVRHDESNSKETRFGLYPEILRNLFSMRAEMKEHMEKYKNQKEKMEKDFADKGEDPAKNKQYLDCIFNLNYCDTKQKALKVYMNCFYGELGNKNSPLFILELAGGITSAGQNNLKKVKKFIENKGCKVYYGDTDSLYFTFSDSEFMDIHKRYFLSNCGKRLFKEEYCTLLVEKTFELVKIMSKEVNDFLRLDNGTRYLKMAYEEVLYPVVFLSRKKYYGIAHENIVNFKPKKLFVRGLEVKKRGVSEILRIVCMETMWQSMDIYNFKSLRQMVLEKIDYLYSKEWKMEEFVQTGLWKPNKKNQTLIKYIERLISEGRDPPDAYERFNYVIVKITDPMRLYDFKGRKIDIKKGDKMEYIDYAKKNNMQIDLDYYFEKQLTGQFARLICYDDEFHIYSNNEWREDDEMIIEDDKTMRMCKKFIKEYAKKWNNMDKDYGTVYKNIFRSANKIINNNKQSILSKNKHLSIMFSSECIDLDNIDISIDYRKIINDRVEEILNYTNIKDNRKKDAENIIKDLKKKNSNTTKMFCNNKYSFKQKMITKLEKEKEIQTINYIKYVKENQLEDFIFKANECSIKSIIDVVRSNVDLDNTDNQDYLENIIKTNAGKFNKLYGNDIHELYIRIKKAYSMFIDIASIHKNIILYEDIQQYNLNTITKNNTRIINPSEFRL